MRRDAVLALRALDVELEVATTSAALDARVRASLAKRAGGRDRRGPRAGFVLAIAFAATAAVALGPGARRAWSPSREGGSEVARERTDHDRDPDRDRSPDRDAPDAGPTRRAPRLPLVPAPLEREPRAPVEPLAPRRSIDRLLERGPRGDATFDDDARSPWILADPTRARASSPAPSLALGPSSAASPPLARRATSSAPSSPSPSSAQQGRDPSGVVGAQRAPAADPGAQSGTTGDCKAFQVGDGTCADDGLFKALVPAWCFQGTFELSPLDDCGGGQSTYANVKCCPATSQPQSSCSEHTIGDGKTCLADDDLKAMEAACPPGTVVGDQKLTMDCADGKSTQLYYTCCASKPSTCDAPVVLGDGTTCYDAGVLEGMAKEACKDGKVVTDFGGAPCGNGGESMVKFACCTP